MDYSVEQEFKKVWGALRCKANCNSVGTPSLPLNSIQYNNAGAFFGDVLFTRDPVTNETFIGLIDTNLESILQITPTSNALTWDADTTDEITTKLEQSQDLFALGTYSGTGLGWEDFVTNIKGLVIVGDGTAGGRTPGDALITTINTATGDQAAVVTYNDPIEGLSVGASAQNGNIVANLSLSSIDGIFNYKTQGGVGQEATVSVTPTETFMSFILDSLSTLYKASLGNGVFLVNDLTNNINYFIIDIINSSMTINPTLVPTYADDAAAGVGGLTSGQLYKTTTLGSTYLKIVP